MSELFTNAKGIKLLEYFCGPCDSPILVDDTSSDESTSLDTSV